ncbi:apotyrosinase chaperone MelC1 [Streptomyces coffeae]|uniref:Tyrosinase co-factor n=1 Tax=Streptomyces coffeae TaxID=621382 RepID=A0ABS1NBS0_9ACTN|nr:tyrosinase family oxidase copper chaperone [Streptomyces coffeae]MBL1097330.1 tyrosinase co-factor [Streptomyces coffeae]
MSCPTRRRVLHRGVAGLAGAVLAGPVAAATTPDAFAAPRSTGGTEHAKAHRRPADDEMPEPFDEMYQGRHIEGWPEEGDHGGHGGHGGPHEGMEFVVRIDNDDLHVMRNVDGTWVSLVNHYETFPAPRGVARAAVRELNGADLVPVVTG